MVNLDQNPIQMQINLQESHLILIALLKKFLQVQGILQYYQIMVNYIALVIIAKVNALVFIQDILILLKLSLKTQKKLLMFTAVIIIMLLYFQMVNCIVGVILHQVNQDTQKETLQLILLNQFNHLKENMLIVLDQDFK